MGIFLFGISMGEIILLFLVVLMLFGSKKIPDLARSLGKGMNEFRKAADDIKREFDESTSEIKEEMTEIEENIRQNSKEIRELADDVHRENYGPHDDSAVKDIYGLDKPERSEEEEEETEKDSIQNSEEKKPKSSHSESDLPEDTIDLDTDHSDKEK